MQSYECSSASIAALAQSGSIHFFVPITPTLCIEQRSTTRSFLLASSALLEESELALIDKRESRSSRESLNCVDVVTEFCGVSLESISFGSGSANSRADTYDTSVDGAGHTVLLLDVDLGKCEVLLVVCVVVLNISTRGPVNHLSHLEALDRLVLWHASGAVDASHSILVAAVVLASAVVSSL